MAYQAFINNIKPDFTNSMYYIRAPRKWGKTTLFRDIVLEYGKGDPMYGVLIQFGNENSATALDNIFMVTVNSWKDMMELKADIIAKKPPFDKVKIIGFDTTDEMFPLAEEQTIAESNSEARKENQRKNASRKKGDKEIPLVLSRSVLTAFGGFNRGKLHTVEKVVIPMFKEFHDNGFCCIAIGHTKEKSQKTTGNLDDDGYMVLTSDLDGTYERGMAYIFDNVFTGYIERNYDEIEETAFNRTVKKKYLIGNGERRLYLRDTNRIDAGSALQEGSVPEYIVIKSSFEQNNARVFIETIEEGLRLSKLENRQELIQKIQNEIEQEKLSLATDKPKEIYAEDEVKEPSIDDLDLDIDLLSEEDAVPVKLQESSDENVMLAEGKATLEEEQKSELVSKIIEKFKEAKKDIQDEIKGLRGNTKLADLPDETLLKMKDILKIKL